MNNCHKIKVALIGGGINSAVGYSHRVAIEMDGKFEILAGCFSLLKNISKKTVEHWGLNNCRIYTNWKKMLSLEKGNIDAIVILTPTPIHKEMIIHAIKAGYFVISEKALCLSSNEALDIQHNLLKYKGYLAVTYNYSGYPLVRELAKIIELGKLGEIQHIHAEMPQEGFIKVNSKTQKPWAPQSWRLQDQYIPTISLDLGVHIHQLIKFLINESPISLVSQQNSFGAFSNVIDDINCLANYSNGATANIWYGKSALGYKNGLSLRVFGGEGAAEWFQMEPEYLYLTDKYGHKSIIDRSHQNLMVANENRYNRFKPGHPAGFIEAFANYYLDIYNEIMTIKGYYQIESPYIHGLETAFEGLRFLEAINQSALNKTWFNIDLS